MSHPLYLSIKPSIHPSFYLPSLCVPALTVGLVFRSESLEAVKERVKALLQATTPPLPAPLLDEAKRITRVAVLNGLALSKAMGAQTPPKPPRDPAADFTHHPIYPVISF